MRRRRGKQRLAARPCLREAEAGWVSSPGHQRCGSCLCTHSSHTGTAGTEEVLCICLAPLPFKCSQMVQDTRVHSSVLGLRIRNEAPKMNQLAKGLLTSTWRGGEGAGPRRKPRWSDCGAPGVLGGLWAPHYSPQSSGKPLLSEAAGTPLTLGTQG